MNFVDLLEDYNVYPKNQNAVQSGPDIGMTTGDMEHTFPNQGGIIAGELLPRKVELKLNKEVIEKLYELFSTALKDV